MERPHVYGVELSRLRNLSTSPQPPRKIHFRLESDTLPVRDSYLDLYIPEFHQYRSHNGRQVRHLDITSTWRSLSIAHAEELKFWEEMAAAVLEYTISNHLIDLIDCMDDCNIDRYPGDLDGRICSFTNNLGSKTFPVSVREIVACILELYKRHGSQHQWLASGGNFHNALCEFLRTRDCFLDTPPHPVVKVSFSASLSSQGEPNVVGILARFGPLVGFNRLDTYTTEDAWCHIHPKHMEPVLDPAYPSLLGRPEYRLASDWIKFTWENDDEGFHDTHSKTSVDEYVVIQPPHTTPSPQNSSESNVPLEMKRISQSSIRTPCNKIIHYPGVSTSPKAPNGYSLCPASAPPARRRADSVLGISMPIRPSSATRTWTDNTIDGTGNSSGLFGTTDDDHQYESCPTWVVWANNDAGGGKHCVLEQARKGKLTPPSDVTAERMRSKLEEIQEILQTDAMKRMKEWYDAMVLKQDTPCKKTREELSEEEAYGRLFLGGDSGEEADVDEA
ncbi:hypothetical protein GTA08_BOTSDO01424 [Botryosphaeria dothidea]|uniref:Uncharacterized protein n=1 Tax=Botryosphaeria dothidea TaxID=55169 RepID=A0A8H4J5R1_9PEZI|nr:hypothetical protein GTA08_BOTSDO01424 [Botryosphaeria dothidea]